MARDWREYLELAGLAAVVASLIFVGLEIRQNTAQIRGEASASVTEAINNLNSAIYENGDLAELNHRGGLSFKELTPVEQSRLRAFWFSQLNVADFVIQLEKEGIENVQFDFVRITVWQFKKSPGRQQFWTSIRDSWPGSAELYDLIED